MEQECPKCGCVSLRECVHDGPEGQDETWAHWECACGYRTECMPVVDDETEEDGED